MTASKQAEALAMLLSRPHLLFAHLDRSQNCWVWTGSKNNSGYGSIRIARTSVLAHRAAYFLAHGSINTNECICHRCDNPACCNPNHLFAASHAENMADMRQKERRKNINTREKNGRAVLDSAAVIEIRRMRNEGAVLKELSARYGVSNSTISRVCRMENWK